MWQRIGAAIFLLIFLGALTLIVLEFWKGPTAPPPEPAAGAKP